MKKVICLLLCFVFIFTSCAKEHIHEFEEWSTIKNPTCTENGIKERFCSCGERLESEILAEGHSSGDWITDVEESCSSDGKKHRECENCKEILEEEIIAANHKAGDWIVDVEATCFENGKRHSECVLCGETISEEDIISSGHKLIKDPAVAASCTKSGLSEGEHCSICGTVVKKQETVPAKGHKWGKNSCTVCGSNMVFGIGETWIVDGQWEFTIDSVKKHYACNYLDEIEEGQAVVMIEYHYKNIGYVGNLQDLFISALDLDVYDENGFSGKMYGCVHSNYPTPCVYGTSSKVVYGFLIPSESDFITIAVEHIIPPGGSAKARFEVPVK